MALLLDQLNVNEVFTTSIWFLILFVVSITLYAEKTISKSLFCHFVLISARNRSTSLQQQQTFQWPKTSTKKHASCHSGPSAPVARSSLSRSSKSYIRTSTLTRSHKCRYCVSSLVVSEGLCQGLWIRQWIQSWPIADIQQIHISSQTYAWQRWRKKW